MFAGLLSSLSSSRFYMAPMCILPEEKPSVFKIVAKGSSLTSKCVDLFSKEVNLRQCCLENCMHRKREQNALQVDLVCKQLTKCLLSSELPSIKPWFAFV